METKGICCQGDGFWNFNRHNNYHYQLQLPGKVADNEVGQIVLIKIYPDIIL